MSAKVRIQVTKYYDLEIENASSWGEAKGAGDAIDVSGVESNHTVRYCDVVAVYAPLRVADWKHHENDPPHVLVCEAPFGALFTDENITAILDAVRSAGIDIIDFWNGSGCESLSMRRPDDSPRPTRNQLRKINKAIEDQVPDYSRALEKWNR